MRRPRLYASSTSRKLPSLLTSAQRFCILLACSRLSSLAYPYASRTLDPKAEGTIIDNVLLRGKIKAVAAKDNITAIKIKSSRMLFATGFLRKVFEIFECYQTPIDMITTSEVGVSMSIDNTSHLNEIVDELKKYGTVTVDSDMCIVCVVGDLDWNNLGFESIVLDAMKNIPVRMISYGGSNYNISFLIRESDKVRALQSLSDVLFNHK